MFKQHIASPILEFELLTRTTKVGKMKPQVKTKTLITNWAINNTIDYNSYQYNAPNNNAKQKQ